ncbi:phosphatase PAP2 family protein [Cupriavidus sp. WKF15]|uniref:phosphatase PAP2 family protein n=1 Tax=Cupriavidus sp. WKF15 TaxID=3032282 RepID=UPI0023E30D37|nr:phosphatase PAP2 family protein [Cupriavidus sp. WKF15]WER47345.1 phosphatase PAP2 family protein [Cupriavidus sp. WKF15]
MYSWQLISRLGESAYLLPSALFIALWLCYRRTPGSALLWLAAVAVAAGLTLISKLAFMGWGMGIPALDFTGVSGHSAVSAAVLPVLLYLSAPTTRHGLARFSAYCGVGLALLIGWSRLVLHTHSLSEVLAGLTLGLAASLTFLNWRRANALPRSVAPLIGTLAFFSAIHGLPVPYFVDNTHYWVERTAVRLSGRDFPYRRGERG